ncbi:hypothetical protein F2Q70_00018349 [Brassica cretica]|uniref:Uncharacterized protein n=1 Tax=Brassica cretica TaxID=69181 RepID=A0A8S9I106_BRACR|nr:hypothetical protein F2Q70_00018349 [Brassica cretica]
MSSTSGSSVCGAWDLTCGGNAVLVRSFRATGRKISPVACLTSPLNSIRGVALRIRVPSSNPRLWYTAWKMMLLELPLSTSILLTRQFATGSVTMKAS